VAAFCGASGLPPTEVCAEATPDSITATTTAAPLNRLPAIAAIDPIPDPASQNIRLSGGLVTVSISLTKRFFVGSKGDYGVVPANQAV
jgi:hypothetical protein